MMEYEKNKSHNFDVNTAGKEPPPPQPNIDKESMKVRYHIHGHFIEDRMPDGKHFPVHHEIKKDVETFAELQNTYDQFLDDYNKLYCYGLVIGIAEEPSLVE